MRNSHQVTSNISSILIGRSIELIINLITITLIARYLGVEKYGIFNSILALTVIISKFSDMGMAPIVFRECSKKEKNIDILNTSLTLRIICVIILFILFNTITSVIRSNETEVLLSNILLLNLVFSSKYMNFRELFEILFKVNLKMFNVMLFNIIDSIVLLALVFLMPYFNGGLKYLVIAYVISNIPGFSLLIFDLKKKYKYRFSFSLKQSYWLIKESIPLFGTLVFTALFQQADVLFLKILDSEYSVGIYSAALRLIVPLAIIPQALITTVFPIIVRGREIDSRNNKFSTVLVFKILFLFSVSLALIVSFISQKIIVIFFGSEYSDAYLPMIILFWSILFTFFNTFSINLITVYNKQKINFFVTLIVFITQFAFIYLLTPLYSYSGVAASRLIASLIGSMLFFIALKHIGIFYNFLTVSIMKWLVLIAICTLAFSFFPIYVYLPLELFVIIISVLKLNYFSHNEMDILLKAIDYDSWKQKLRIHPWKFR